MGSGFRTSVVFTPRSGMTAALSIGCSLMSKMGRGGTPPIAARPRAELGVRARRDGVLMPKYPRGGTLISQTRPRANGSFHNSCPSTGDDD
jgi:hypothetical protein